MEPEQERRGYRSCNFEGRNRKERGQYGPISILYLIFIERSIILYNTSERFKTLPNHVLDPEDSVGVSKIRAHFKKYQTECKPWFCNFCASFFSKSMFNIGRELSSELWSSPLEVSDDLGRKGYR